MAPDRHAAPRPLMRGRYLVRSLKGFAVLRVLDALLGVMRRRPPPVPQSPARILVCNWAHLGDVLLSLPTLLALRNMFPAARIGLLLGHGSACVVGGTGLYDDLHVIAHPLLSRSAGGRWSKFCRYLRDRRSTLRALRAARYDVAIDLYFYLPPVAPLLWQAGIPVRCGYTSGGGGALLTHPVDWSLAGRPVSAFGGDLLHVLWPAQAAGALLPWYPGHRAPEAAARYLVIHAGAGSRAREWPDTHWRNVVEALADGPNALVFCGVGAREAARATALAAGLPAGRASLFIDRPWPAFVALVAGAAGIICLESASAHLAAAFAVPTVAIYTGTNEPELWGPNNPHARVLTAPTGCAPCHRTGCATMACVRNVRPADVLAALEDLGLAHDSSVAKTA